MSLARGIPTIALSVALTWPFSIPSTAESAAARIVRNLARFKLLYALFIWGVLAIALIPARKVSLLLLSVTGNFTLLYALLLRAMPDSVVLHRLIDKRLVAALVVTGTAVEMILTRAGIHLVIVVVSCIPVILLHAALVAPESDGFFCRIDGGREEATHDDADEKLALDYV